MSRLHSLTSLALLSLLLAGCGPKRPPVVTTSAGGSGAGNRTGSSGTATEAIDSGPDVQAVDEGVLDESQLSDASGEGGPLADVRFDYDQAALTDATRATLEQEHAAWIQAHPDVRVTVEGHCDERGTVEYNLALGDQRAQVTRDYLVSLGVAAGRLTSVSYGKERPLDLGSGEAAWARNRRAHFAVLR